MISATEGALVRVSPHDARWTAFASAHPAASVSHLPEWSQLLADCYDFDTFVLAIVAHDRIVWGVPAMEVKSPFRPRRWISLPFSDECGPLGDASSVPSVFDSLDRIRRESSIPSHEIRAALPLGQQILRGYSHTLDLSVGHEQLARGYRSSIRQGIRVAEREGVVVRIADRKTDLTETFYRLHVDTRRRLGVPVQTRRFFSLLWDHLIEPSHGFVLVAERGGVALAAAVFLRAGRTVLYKFGASDAKHWKLRANSALFHEAIGRSAAAGAEIFDWGRTDLEDDGLRRFKSSWGTSERELVYTTLGHAAADASRSGSGRARQIAGHVIRRSPAVVCRAAGALLYRYAA